MDALLRVLLFRATADGEKEGDPYCGRFRRDARAATTLRCGLLLRLRRPPEEAEVGDCLES